MIVILASASPRRKELIAKIDDLQVKIIPSTVDENCEITNAEDYVCALANRKARDVYAKTGIVTIGADTVVVLENEILGKPKDENDAINTIKKLCSKTHRVLTGVSIVSDKKEITKCETTFVTFNDYDEEIVKSYVKSAKPLDKAGAYGLQDKELEPIVKSVVGDEDNVIGLPVKLLESMLENFRN